MIDAFIRPLIDPPLNKMGSLLARASISANLVTGIGMLFGLAAMVALSQHYYALGAGLFLMNRIMDGLDGGVARANGLTDFGGFLDIASDFMIYPGIPFAMAIANPDYLLPALYVVFSMSAAMTTFLAFAIMAEKRSLSSSKRGRKSFFFLGGLCEGTETFIALLAMCAFPNFFKEIAYTFGTLCWLTTFGRILQARALLS